VLSYFRWVLFFIALFVTVMGGALFLGNTLLTARDRSTRPRTS
jgi:hypothetical protein